MIPVKNIIQRLCETKVWQNYSYLSAIQIANALIGVLIYPYLIRVLGAEAMGTYAFLFGIVMYFQSLVEYGFDMPAAKAVSIFYNKPNELNRIVSQIGICKFLMFLIATTIAFFVVFFVPFLRDKALVFGILFIQIIYSIVFPWWYYQGMKNMRFSTIVQFVIRMLQIPFILIFVKSANDIISYAMIVSGTMLCGGFFCIWNMYAEGRRFVRVSWSEIKKCFFEAFPFFITNVSATIKERTLTMLIGSFLGMSQVAIYDLAMKIIQIPRILSNSINVALFPEIVRNVTPNRVKSILRYERVIGLVEMIGLVVLGYPMIWFLGGETMLGAYSVMIILSITLYTNLVAGAYLQFVFVAQGKYSLVAYNQIIAMITCVVLACVGLLFYPTALVVAMALSLSGLFEILFCRILYR